MEEAPGPEGAPEEEGYESEADLPDPDAPGQPQDLDDRPVEDLPDDLEGMEDNVSFPLFSDT